MDVLFLGSFTFIEILIDCSESDLRRRIGGVGHLSVNAEYLSVDQTMGLQLRQEVVFVFTVVNAFTKT